MRRGPRWAFLLVLAGTAALADSLPPEPAGYRLDQYRGATPMTVEGRSAIDTDEAHRLWANKEAIFIDVLPAVRRPDALPAGAVWAPRPRRAIPGSIWLPEVGRGALDPEHEKWFREHLVEATRGDPNVPIVFYCLSECWMSWNAAKRALEWGYTGVLWYRDGTDGWAAKELPLAEIVPPDDMPR